MRLVMSVWRSYRCFPLFDLSFLLFSVTHVLLMGVFSGGPSEIFGNDTPRKKREEEGVVYVYVG